ncbi:MAG TPA: Heimdall-CTERM domain-containing surface protein, partial [Candidatus Thermoplasmatota archaeon]|nr:Heimdall-CTERM domain-containing surface protein [Candidatus Thermoplasmatota archaeon]
KVYSVQIVGPNTAPAPGEEFTVSIIANGAALAGATVEFNGNTYTSNARGELTLTAPDSAGSYTVTAAYENYEDGTLTINVEEGEADGVPGFELLTLVAALGVAFILLRRRRQ